MLARGGEGERVRGRGREEGGRMGGGGRKEGGNRKGKRGRRVEKEEKKDLRMIAGGGATNLDAR